MATSSSSGNNTSLKVSLSANIESADKTNNIGEKSLKSQRTYQVGVVFKDIYGRETPVFTDKKGTFTVPKAVCDKKSSIVTKLNNKVPNWVDTYKFFVKETSNEYYNACMDRWYDSEDGNLWLSFPSAERNKMQEDGYIILKKQAVSQDAVIEEARYKIIDIQNEAPDDIKTDFEDYGVDTITVLGGGALPGSKTIKFEFTDTDGSGAANEWDQSVFFDAQKISTNLSNTTGITDTGFIGWPLDNVAIKISNTAGITTGYLDVANIYKDGTALFVELSKPLIGSNDGTNAVTDSVISSIIPDLTSADDVQVRIARKVVKNKKEFDGKFFVKIARDAVLDRKVREVGNVTASFTVQEQIDMYSLTTTKVNSTETHWENVEENWFIDSASRANVGTGGGSGIYGPYDRDNGFGISGNDAALNPRSGDSQSSLQCTMELSLNRIKDGNKDGYDISNNTQNNQDFLNKISQEGTLFRWLEDPYQHVYRVVSCGDSRDLNTTEGPPDHKYKKGILNYSSKKSDRKAKKNKSIRLYLTFVTTGWRLESPQSGSDYGGTYIFDENDEAKRPFNFDNQYPGSITHPVHPAWDPTKKGFGQYAGATSPSNTTGTINQDIELGGSLSADNTNRNTMQILSLDVGDQEPVFTTDPAVWETEPREDVGLDIYFEASQAYPTRLTDQTNELFAPYGCTVTCVDVINNKTFFLPEGTQLYDWAPNGNGGNTLLLTARANEVGILDKTASTATNDPANTTPPFYLTTLTTGTYEVNGVEIETTPPSTSNIFTDLNNDFVGLELRFTKQDGSYTTAKIKEFSVWNNNNQNAIPSLIDSTNTDRIKITLSRDLTNNNIKLPYFNCYSFGNGVESDRIRDDFNQVRIGKGVKASTVPPIPYQEEIKTNGLIYSGIWNSNNSINRLNQFIAAEKITKDVSPTYGSIQKLKARDTDLVAFCEDKILKIQAYKDALYSADGKPQLIASNNVLGDVSSFKGEFGISKNPESYAEDGYRMYCTDKQRGEVLRISMDGITPISNIGMDDFFGDNLKLQQELRGSFDDRKDEYNLTLITTNRSATTVSFSEKAKGWTSFKSFIPETGVSLNNDYYTFKNAEIYKHHTNQTRNEFYGDPYESYLDIVFNEMPGIVKNFTYMNYEGTQAKIIENITDQEYYNNIAKKGWYIESGFTDLQEAGSMYFKDKEGKWFSYMKGKSVSTISDLNSKEFSFQGIGICDNITTDSGSTTPTTTTTTTTTTTPVTTTTTGVSTTGVITVGQGSSGGTSTSGGSTPSPQPITTFTITVRDLGDED